MLDAYPATEEETPPRAPERARGGPTVWVVSELYYPEETSTGLIITEIAESLARSRDVRVLCGQPNYAARGTRAPAREERRGVRIRRCPGTRLDKDVLPFRALNALTLTSSLFAAQVASFRRGDVVLVVTTPPTLPLLTGLAARMKGARCVVLVHDVYPEVAVATGVASPGSPAVRASDRLTRRLLAAADRVVVCGRDMGKLIEAKLEADRDKVVFIPNWAELDRVSPGPRDANPLLAELGLEDRFVVQVAGNIGRPHAVSTLCDAAVLLREHRDVHFLVIGSGSRVRELEERIERDGLTSVTLLGPRPRGDQQLFLNACDVGLMLFVEGMLGLGVPSRAYNIMAAGKPLIAALDPRSEIATVVEEERIGWVAGVEDAGRLAACILEARADRARLAEMGARARLAALHRFSPRAVLPMYGRLVDGLLAEGGAAAGGAP